jgi:hypothetical protein
MLGALSHGEEPLSKSEDFYLKIEDRSPKI